MGKCFDDYCRNQVAMAIIPFNWIVRYIRIFWLFICAGPKKEDLIDRAFERGKEAGIKIGKTQSMLEYEEKRFNERIRGNSHL